MPSSSRRRKPIKSEVTNTKYPANTLPRLTPGQARSVRKLTRQCCNNDNGNCLLLDDGDPCVCPQAISYTLICKHFRRGVLPLEPELEDEILHPKGTRRCEVCGAFFWPVPDAQNTVRNVPQRYTESKRLHTPANGGPV